MSTASAAPFSGLSRPANTAPSAAAGDQGMTRVGTYGGRVACTRTTRPQALAWNLDTPATAGGRRPPAAPRPAPPLAGAGGRCRAGTTRARRLPAGPEARATDAWLSAPLEGVF